MLDEVLEFKRRGCQVTLFPLIREGSGAQHPETLQVQHDLVYSPFISRAILAANWRMLRAAPLRYVRTLVSTFVRVAPSLNFTLGAAGIWLKSVYLAEEARRRGIGHLHAHFCTHPTLAAWIIQRLVGIPYSFTAHGSDLHVDQTMLAEKVRRARFAVMISRYNLEFAVARIGEALRPKLLLIHCGIDNTAFVPVPVPQGDPLRILCIALLRPVKGHASLLRACRLLTERGLAWHLSLIGDGALRGELESLCDRLEISAQVAFLGQQPRPVVHAHLGACQVVALTSVMDRQGRREGIPVSLMEALAMARPVVASRLSGIPELIEHGRTGLLAEPGNPVDIADQLQWISQHPDAARGLARQGRQRVREAFDVRTNAACLIDAITADASSRAPVSSGSTGADR
ncbi:glycosyltransferase [uncultured Lamprocystis sp.]|uniref:glycosyltransferase n=1 Tax=uncultured Lamprocystis sp. TaxID=543132 RepID=UPI0025E28B72|nr:glycosyltransferase [uncultured Lamprocystis sp.]